MAQLFEDVHDLGQKFNQELDDQEGKLVNVVDNLEVANKDTQKGV